MEEPNDNSATTRSEEEIQTYLVQKIPKESWHLPRPDEDAMKRMAENLREMVDEKNHNFMDYLKGFMKGFIHKDKLLTTVKSLKEFLLPNEKLPAQNERMFVGISHKVSQTALTHDFDVKALNTRICNVFEEFYENKNKGDFNAPYFCFLQSSGMGKTKVIYELSQQYKRSKTTTGKLVLCRPRKTGKEAEAEGDLFDFFLDFSQVPGSSALFLEIVEGVFKILDGILEGVDRQKVVLFFDEAHYLLGRRKYKKDGTTASLGNFINDDDFDESLRTDTLDSTWFTPNDYYTRGLRTFDPCCVTTTTGCLRFSKIESSSESDCEYDRARMYGRPLFAVMTKKELANGEVHVLQRMIQNSWINPQMWEDERISWFSILGTRVQMGQTSFSVASSTVAKSYANLVGVTNMDSEAKKSARICFPPDPVCARLAMCLMDENWKLLLPNSDPKDLSIQGKCKSWWVTKMKELYIHQICAPEKGDLGEVMVALYFLFCADTLRSSPYTTFSVPLHEWIQCLVGGGKPRATELAGTKRRSEEAQKEHEGSNLYFNTIQVCRNYTRAYGNSWALLQNEAFLEYMYTSAIGFYLFDGCGTIDLVFALRGDGEAKYIPMFVSVKSHLYFSPDAAKKECAAMEAKVEKSKKGALCLLVVFGSNANSKDDDFELKPDCVGLLKEGKTVCRVLRVPTRDVFGLSEAYLELSTFQEEMPEVLASHSFLGAHVQASRGQTSKVFGAEQVLRLRPKLDKGGAERKSDVMTDTVSELLDDLERIVSNKS